MTDRKVFVVIGGTSGIGREIAGRAADRGQTVILSGRDADHARQVAVEIGGDTRGIAVDLSRPAGLAGQLAGIDRVDHLVLTAMARDQNTVRTYDASTAVALVTMKLVGYTQVIHLLRPAMPDDGAIVVFGGLAKDRPYPGSTTVSTVNAGVVGLVHTLATELPPVRINAIHPGLVGDSPYWSGKPLEQVVARTPLGRLATMADIAEVVEFLLHNRAVTGVNLPVDGGWSLR